MHALLWSRPGEVIDAQGATVDITNSASWSIDEKHTGREAMGAVQWTASPLQRRSIPRASLMRRAQPAGVLLAGTSLAEQLASSERFFGSESRGLVRHLAWRAPGMGTTEPHHASRRAVVKGARSVAAGDWSAHVDVSSKDEIGELAGP